MGKWAILSVAALLVLGIGAMNGDTKRYNIDTNDDDLYPSTGKQQQQPEPFAADHEYTFDYDAQIASGIVTTGAIDGQQPLNGAGDEERQMSATRLQCQAKIAFTASGQATLRLQRMRIAQANALDIANPQRIQPMQLFTARKQLDEQKQRELSLPCAFRYVDGVVLGIQFHAEDNAWSKNVKRAVLNLIQLNLKQKQQEQQQQQQWNSSSEEDEEEQSGEKQQMISKAFTIPETTIEGDCLTTYSINGASQQEQQGRWNTNDNNNKQQMFNVTKSVDFQRCNAVADIAYGFQSADATPAECQRCQNTNYNSGIGSNGKPQLSSCSAACDPKEVKSEQVDRTTVQRFQLAGSPSGKYAIQSAQSVSHYIYRESKVQSDVEQPSAMHTVACAQLTYRGKKSASQSGQESIPKNGKQETLLYDNEWDHAEKEYYMYGDATLNRDSGRRSPFAHVSKSAAEQAQSIYAKLIHAAADKSHGIESEVAVQIQRLVELLRMCTVQELNGIHNALVNAQKQQSASRADAVKVEQLFADTLAMAGTRNTIHVLAEKIQRHQMSSLKAAQTMKNLRNVPAPSDQIAEIVEKLCRSESAERSEPLRQSCWLMYGAMVGQMCSDKKSAKQQQQLVFGVQSGFDKTQACTPAKKQHYKKTLMTLYKKADTTYEKVLALKTIGNAGLEEFIPELAQIAAANNNEKQERILPRCVAIDAMRRVSQRQPEQIQGALLPIFQNAEQPTEVRIAATAILLRTQLSATVIDQLAYTLASESDEQVQAFVYSIMQANAQSPIAAQQQLASHLKSALQMAGVEESTLRAAASKQIGGSWAAFTTALFSQKQQEGLIGKWMSVFTDRQILPTHLGASVDTLFGGQRQNDALKLSVTQQDTNTWVENLVNAIVNSGSYSSSSSGKSRANRAAVTPSRSAEAEIRRIFKGFNVKSRMNSNSNSQQQNQQPFGMACIRIGDIDMVVIPADRDTIPAPLQQLLTNSGKQLSESDLSQIQQFTAKALAQPIRALHALKLNEKNAKIPTSCGLPLLVSRATSLLSATDIHVKIGNNDDEEEYSMKAHLNAHMIATLSHSQKMECWTPCVATGVQHQHALEFNAPLNADISIQLTAANGGIQKPSVRVAVKVPQAPKTRLFGLHTLPSTYARDFDEKTKMLREPKLRSAAVPNHALNSAMPVQEIDVTYGESVFGAPLIRVSGHVHAPRRLTDYAQLAQWCLAAENHIHVTLETAGNAVPREIIFNVKASAFQKMPTGSVKPGFDGFYSDAAQFKSVNADDFEGMELDDNKNRQKNLRNALNKMEQKKQQQQSEFYKHELKWSVEAVGGNGQSSPLKAECKIDTVCDAKYRYCKLNANVERNALFADESQPWKLKSNIEMLSPDTVSNVQQLKRFADEKNQKFIAQVDTTWGADHQQKINIRIQGEQALNKRQRQSLEQCSSYDKDNNDCDSRRQQKSMRLAAFCNKFDAAVVYKCHPYTQNYAASIFDALKTYNFWSTESQYVDSSANQDGELYAGLLIDALAPRYANFSVRTPSQTVTIRNVQLPFAIRPLQLVSGEQKSTHSFAQALQRMTASRRAECSVDGRRVNTFDNVLYKAPITQCYSALAKDCRNVDEPKFAVLMKSLDKDGQQKKIKIVTPQHIIECQPASTNAEEQKNADKMIQCRINGEPINIEQEQQQWQSSGLATVEYNNEEQTAVTIYVADGQVAVRFGCQCADCSCQKAWIRLSDAYKNAQCGLCGHFDDTLADEWRMADNEKADDLTQFHRSYLMQNEKQDQDSKNGECSPAQQQAFYMANQNRFGLIRGYGIKSQMDESSSKEQDQNEPEYWKNYNGGYVNNDEQSSYESSDEQPQENWQKSGQKSGKNSSLQEPKLRTKIIEQPHQICFSVKPVKQCPSGTQSIFDQANANDSDYASDENDEEAPDAQKVKFACISRHSGEARRLQREARRGNGVVSVAQSGHDANTAQKIRQPVKCRRY